MRCLWSSLLPTEGPFERLEHRPDRRDTWGWLRSGARREAGGAGGWTDEAGEGNASPQREGTSGYPVGSFTS